MRNPTNNRETTRWAARAGAMVIVTAALVAVQLAMAPPASAVTGLHRETGSSSIDSHSPKSATAFCPEGEYVIGGGGQAVLSDGTFTPRLALTRLRPSHFVNGAAVDRYQVTAAETTPGITDTWFVRAYALCAPASSLTGYQIVLGGTEFSSKPVQATAAVCPAGKVVLGTGGIINTPDPAGQVVLQVARASATGDIARVQAHEDADGYAANWAVFAYAVCVNPPSGYQVVYGESEERLSEPKKVAVAECPGNKRVHGAGAAITSTAPGNVALQAVVPFYAPFSDLKQVHALAVENTPTKQNWDFIVAQAICAD